MSSPLLLAIALVASPCPAPPAAVASSITHIELYQRTPTKKQKKRRKKRVPTQPAHTPAELEVPNLEIVEVDNTARMNWGKMDSAISNRPKHVKAEVPPSPDEEMLSAQKNDPTFTPPTWNTALLAQRLHYPKIAQDNRLEGSAVVRTMLDSTGRVTGTQVISATNSIFRSAAGEVVQGTPFTPGRRSGIPVQSCVDVEVHFTLPK